MSSVGDIIRLPYLPNEMWAEIFSHLSLCDRKRIRLSCRHFYDIVNCERFHQDEKLVIYGDVDANEIEGMRHSRRKMWTIELNRLQPEDTCIVRVFIMHNLHIRSLRFVNCKLAPGTFLEIIEYSVRLRHVTLIFDSLVEIESLENVLNDVRVLRDNGFLCHEVRSVSLEMKLSSELSWLGSLYNLCDDFHLFRAIFPNIAHVQLSTSHGEEFDHANVFKVQCSACLLTKLKLLANRRRISELDRMVRDARKRDLSPDGQLLADKYLLMINEEWCESMKEILLKINQMVENLPNYAELARQNFELAQQDVELMQYHAEIFRPDFELLNELYSRYDIHKFSL